MFVNSLRVATLLARRYIRYTNKWMSILVIFVMMLTFLNLVVVTGILVGLIEGSEQTFRKQYSGDVLVSTLPDKSYIEKSDDIIAMINDLETIRAYTPRYAVSGQIEANFQRDVGTTNTLPDTAGGEVVGIDPEREGTVTGLADLIIEGQFLDATDQDQVVLGGNLLDRYLPASTGISTVSDVYPGDKILLSVGDITREMTVKGVLRGKAGQVDQRIYLSSHQLRKLVNRYDYNVDEIAIDVISGVTPSSVKHQLIARGADRNALVRTSSESIGDFLEDIKSTFGLLGNVIGSIGLAVASITIFIVIFIMAITRQKSIGILKGIGINDLAIELSYVFLSLFYSIIGVTLGLFLIYFVLVPYFQANPIDFPFSDGILAVNTASTTIRTILILITTLIAGYLPAKLVVRKKALDAILGR